jgi:outer membrane biosynthesis protein TonB
VAAKLKNPISGKVVEVRPGESAEVSYTCNNDADKPVPFVLDVEGLPDTWAASDGQTVVPPFSEGTFTLKLTPPADSGEGDYPMSVRILCDGAMVDPPGERELVLRVVIPEEPVFAEPEPPAPLEMEHEPEIEEAAAAEPEAPLPLAEEEPKPEPKPEEPKPQPTPRPSAAPKPKPKVVEMPTEPEPEEPPPPPTPIADKVVANPPDGAIIYLRPGESAVVSFSFKNDQKGTRTFVLQEDRALHQDWISLVQDQVNITPSGTGEVIFLLKPPISAEPANYPFTVSVGPYGSPLAPYGMTLVVQPAPAVTLAAKRTAVSVGPFGRDVDFQLEVESAGNADSAYRVSVRDPNADFDDQGRPRGPVDLYEVDRWRYLFDKEMDSVVSPAAGRRPPPQPHRLRISRKGIWWFGLRESHNVTAAAIPVTDLANGGKSGNTVALRAVRWRVLPLPWFLMLPIIIALLILLGSGARNLDVTNAFRADDGSYFILGDKLETRDPLPMRVDLAWESPIYAWLKVTKTAKGGQSLPVASAGRHKATDEVEISQYGTDQLVTFDVAPKLFGAGVSARVCFVPLRTDGMLDFIGPGGPLPGIPASENMGGLLRDVKEISLGVPKTAPIRIDFRNLVPVSAGQTINLWQVRVPASFRIDNLFPTGESFRQLTAGQVLTARITYTGDASAESVEETWQILSTDAKSPVVRFKLRALDTGAAPPPVKQPNPQPQPTQPAPQPQVKPPPTPQVKTTNITSRDSGDPDRAAVMDAVRAQVGADVKFVPIKIVKANGWVFFHCQPTVNSVNKGGPVTALLRKVGGSWTIVEKGGPGDVGRLKAKAQEAGAPMELFR